MDVNKKKGQDLFHIEAGVPTLFLMFINDFLSCTNNPIQLIANKHTKCHSLFEYTT